MAKSNKKATAKGKTSGSNSFTVANNRKARFDYSLSDELEAGLKLTGSEVKSLRHNTANIKESYIAEENGELWLINSYIPEYKEGGTFFNHTPRQKRKLLLHKKEIVKYITALERRGITIIPLSLYFNGKGKAKIKIAIGEGKKNHDKRHDIKERDWKRQQASILKNKQY